MNTADILSRPRHTRAATGIVVAASCGSGQPLEPESELDFHCSDSWFGFRVILPN
jgi:hypothetical protein